MKEFPSRPASTVLSSDPFRLSKRLGHLLPHIIGSCTLKEREHADPP